MNIIKVFAEEDYSIIERNKLFHISNYAASRKKSYDFMSYYINLDDIKDKKVIEVSSTNQGIFDVVWMFPAKIYH